MSLRLSCYSEADASEYQDSLKDMLKMAYSSVAWNEDKFLSAEPTYTHNTQTRTYTETHICTHTHIRTI